MKKFLFLITFIFICLTVRAQYQNPPSVNWSRITTPHFSVIVPDNILSRGIETANILEAAYFPDAQSFHKYPKKIPVALFNQSIISNGYTTLGPRYIGFYTTPPQDAGMVGGIDWLQTLTIHEFRHAVQFHRLDTNFTRFTGRLFGDYGKLIPMYVSVPFWFFEGDAVLNETLYTREGRGRLPSFTRDIRALESEGVHYSYYKAYLGSYKHYYPDHYHLGFLMTTYMRKHFGIETMNKIVDRSTEYSFYPLIFSESMKKYTYLPAQLAYENTMDEFRSYSSQSNNIDINWDYEKVSPPNPRAYTNYTYPNFIDTEKVLALKNGFDDTRTLVIVDKGTEQRLIKIAPVDRVNSNGEIVVWASESPDIRWAERSYSNIMVYNTGSNTLRILTHKGKYYAPAVSPDGSRIAAIEYGDDMRCRLVIVSITTGKEIARLLFDDRQFARMPSWSEDGQKIVFTVTTGQQRSISIYNIQDQSVHEMVPPTFENISNPVFYRQYLLYNSPLNGTDVILAVDTITGEQYIAVSGKYGVYNPSISPDGLSMVYENYTISGMEIARQEIDHRQWIKLSGIKTDYAPYFTDLIKQEDAASIFDSVNLTNREGFKIEKYHPLLHSVNIHSWMPMPIYNGVSFSVLSADILNTTLINAGFNYYLKDNALQEFVLLNYAQYFPVFELEISNGRAYETFADTLYESYINKLDEKVVSAGVRLPFNFSRHIHTTSLTVGTAYKYMTYKFIDPDTNRYHVSALECSLNFSHTIPLSRRDINPKYGEEITVTCWKSLSASELEGSRFNVNASLYLPGLANHHSLILSGGFQQSSPVFRYGIHRLTTDLEPVRGYEREYFDRFIRGTLDYTFPVAYPDIALGPLFYLKRISANVFYDHGLIESGSDSKICNSVGADLNFDFHVLTFMPLPITMGLRYSLRLADNKSAFDLLLFRIPIM